MKALRPIVLLTDFGNRDAYAASMKGVILTLNPRATIVELSHEIGPQNLKQAADILSSSAGALHLRTLNTINDVSSDASNTIVFAVPLEVLRAFERWNNQK